MTNSYAQKGQFTCPQTNKPFKADIWLIVDAAERPDLIERIRAETLHTLTSPYTNKAVGVVDVPLLIYRPRAEPVILFSPAQQSNPTQDQQHAAALLGQLRESLGTAWRDEWVSAGVAGVERPMLLIALSDDLAAELARLERENLELHEQLNQPAGSDIPASIAPGDDAGRKIGQVIHDVVPGASLAFSAASDQASMAARITELAIPAHADAIVDDILYLTEPMFQDGVIADAVDSAEDIGAIYFSSAANAARQPYKDPYRESGIEGE